MRNTKTIVAVFALGLLVPVAFLAGQYVGQNTERNAVASLNQGGGNGLDGLPGQGDPSTYSFSWGMSQPAGVNGGIRVLGNVDALSDQQSIDKHKGWIELQGHKQWFEIGAYLVPPDWDGMASGKRIHSPLTVAGEPGAPEVLDKSSPRLFLSVSYGNFTEIQDTRAVVDYFLKIGKIVEPGAVTAISGLDENDSSIGGRIWVNVSLNYGKIEWTGGIEEVYSTYIELPKSWLLPAAIDDKSSPLLFLGLGAHPNITAIYDDREFTLDASMVFDTSVDIEFGPFSHMEDVSFTFRHMEQVSAHWNIAANKGG